jgi:hypothetical protein
MAYLRSIVGNHVRQYHYIFKTQIDPTKEIDTGKPRDLDPAFRVAASQGIDRVFSELDISFILLDVDSVKAREQVLQKAMSLLTR